MLELYLGVTGSGQGVAHFAHLGGMAAGYVLLVYWRGRRTRPRRLRGLRHGHRIRNGALREKPSTCIDRARESPVTAQQKPVTRDAAAEDAVRTLLAGPAKIPAREGLLETPRRVVDAYSDWFSGYEIDPREYLSRTFEEIGGYDEMVVLRDIEFESHCEHHMAPIIGRAHVGYLPTGKVVGISKLARVVEVFARRFQVQEKMTAEIARCIDDVLQPAGRRAWSSKPCMSA